MSKKLIKQFREETGYTNYCISHGIRKDFKRRNDWDFKSPEQMLLDFIKWQRNRGE